LQLKNIYKNNVIVNEEINKVKNIPLKDREFLYKDEELIDEENEYTEYKHYSYPFSQEKVDEIKRQYCGFLNNHGGRIYLGINDLRIVKGIRLEPKENEIIKNELLNYTNDFYPPCSIDKINLYFIPVRHPKTNKVLHNLYVLKIIVMPGEPYNLYSIHNKGGYISTLRLPGQCINLTAEEIYSELMKRAELLKQKDINDINNQQKKN
jgi:predicted HTH transcriptional regulator